METAYLTTEGDRCTVHISSGEKIVGTLADVVQMVRVRQIIKMMKEPRQGDPDEIPRAGRSIELDDDLKALVEAAEDRILALDDFMTADELGQVAGPGIAALLAQWRASGRIFRVKRGDVYLYPRYAFDFAPELAPKPVIARAIAVLEMGGWHTAVWFSSGNGMLDGRLPKDVIDIEPEDVIAAAIDEAAGITHG